MSTTTLRLAAVLLFWVPLLPAQAAPVVYFDFTGDGVADSNATVALNGTLTASLYVSGIDTAHGGLVSWGSQIDFGNALLNGTGYTIDPLWPLPGVNNVLDNSQGRIDLLATAFSGQVGTLKLADIVFNAVAAGTTFLNSGELYPSNAGFSGFAGADGFDYDPSVVFSSTTITVSAVPLPGALLLFLSGVGGLSALTRRRG
ncbi:MAG TPA: hypothetical protein ENK12_08340 [Gammaproteobacteria bacterium]|nr:hypothetical protein [Gammaproteobacteria bacterium]